MGFDAPARLGIGLALAWTALPLLLRLARRSHAGLPGQYYRTLVAALCIATALIFLPLVRSWSGSQLAMGMGSAVNITLIADLVRPLVRSAQAWPDLPVFAAIGCTWLLLLAAGLSASIVAQLRLHRQYGSCADAPVRARQHAERIARELGIRTPAIRVADGPAVAFSYGVLSPSVVISKSACDMPDKDLDFVLRHELCHVARHDTRAICLIDFAQRCFVGHPSLRAFAAEIRVAREARADAAAAGTRSLEYAQLLLTIAEHMHATRTHSSSLVSMADTALERRVDMLINPKRSRIRRATPWLVLTGFAYCGLVFLTPTSLNNNAQGQAVLAVAFEGREAAMQGLPRHVIQATVRNYLPQLRDCFERLNGKLRTASINLSFIIGSDGKTLEGETVDTSDAAASNEAFAELARCVDDVRRTMQFPPPEDGTVTVSYPLNFEDQPCTDN